MAVHYCTVPLERLLSGRRPGLRMRFDTFLRFRSRLPPGAPPSKALPGSDAARCGIRVTGPDTRSLHWSSRRRQPGASTPRAGTRPSNSRRRRASPGAGGESSATAEHTNPAREWMESSISRARRRQPMTRPRAAAGRCARAAAWRRLESSSPPPPPRPRPPSAPRPGPLLPAPSHPPGCGGGAAATADSAPGSRAPPSLPGPSAPRLPLPLTMCWPSRPRRAPPGSPAAALPQEVTESRPLPPPRPPGLNATHVLTPSLPLTPGLATRPWGPGGKQRAPKPGECEWGRVCARVRTPLAAPGLAREQRRGELGAGEQEERRRRELQGGERTGQGGEVTGLVASCRAGTGAASFLLRPWFIAPVLPLRCGRSMYFRVHTFLSQLCAAGSALGVGAASPARPPSVCAAVAARRSEPAGSGRAGQAGGAGDSGRHGAAPAGVPAAGSRGWYWRLGHAGPHQQRASAPALRALRQRCCFVTGRRRGSFLLR